MSSHFEKKWPGQNNATVKSFFEVYLSEGTIQITHKVLGNDAIAVYFHLHTMSKNI